MQEIMLIRFLIDWYLWEFRVYFVILFYKFHFTGICCLVVISGFWTWFWRVMEQSIRLGMIGIKLNQRIGRLKVTNDKVIAGENWVRHRWVNPNTNSRGKLAAARFECAANELVHERPFNFQQQTCRGEIYAHHQRDFEIRILGFSILF